MLASLLRSAGYTVQGVQRIDLAPRHTDIRYYSSAANDAQVGKLINQIAKYGFASVQKIDLSKTYLKSGCTAPGIYELWIGSDAPLTADGMAGT